MPAIRTALAVVALICLAGCSGTGSLPSAAPGATSLAEATSSPEAPATASAEPEPTHIAAATGAHRRHTEQQPDSRPRGRDKRGHRLCRVGLGGCRCSRETKSSGSIPQRVTSLVRSRTVSTSPVLMVSHGRPSAEHEIRHVDPETMKTVASVPVNTYYVGVGAGSVWAPSGPDVVRIDPETAEVVATIPVHEWLDVTEVDGNDDAVWATVKEANLVYRIDPATNTVVAEIPAGDVSRTASWSSPKRSGSAMPTKRRSRRIDPSTNETLFVDGPGSGVGLGEGSGSVWSSSRDGGDLFRIDPTTSQAVAARCTSVAGPTASLPRIPRCRVSDGLVSVYGIPVQRARID